jgi:hypothetical protein
MPRKHVSTICELTIPEQGATWKLVGEVRECLRTGPKPDDFNTGFNDGLGRRSSTRMFTSPRAAVATRRNACGPIPWQQHAGALVPLSLGIGIGPLFHVTRAPKRALLSGD